MKRTIIGAGLVALALPASAGAHVTVHPNVLPAGAFTAIDVRVPNELDNADTTKVQVALPEGFADVATNPPVGWTAKVRTGKAAVPIKTDDGEETTEVKEITFSGGRIPPGQFENFGLSIGVPGKAGDTLTFKALQTYSNGKVVRWIGSPDADSPAPTVSVSAKGGLVEDSAGEGARQPQAQPAATRTVVEKKSSSGLSIAALVLGALGLLAGGYAVSASRRG
jgi:periplasmic copper chaperone A